jgi:hypothetical protein
MRPHPVFAFLVLLLGLPSPAFPEEGGGAEKEAPPKEEPPPAEEPGAAEEEAPPKEEAESPAEKEPDFSKEPARSEFIKARVLFDEGKYKEAEALFKKSRPDAKSKEDKALVDSWILGSGGIQLLEKMKPKLQAGKRMAAYEQTEAIAKKYKGTPAEPHFKKFLEEIDGQVFVLVQGFDVVTKAYEKPGKSFVEDPTVVYDGTRCLHWTSSNDKAAGTLRIEGTPREWEPFESLIFHVKMVRPPAGMELIVMTDPSGAGGKAKKKSASGVADIFQTPVRMPSPNGEWQRVTVRITDFIPQGKPSFSHVTGIQMQLATGKEFDFLLDKVVLVRKEGGAESGKSQKKKAKK